MRSHTTLIPFITLALAIAASAAPAVDQFYDRRNADNTFVSRSSLDLLERRGDSNLHLLSRTEDSGSGTPRSAGELEARGKKKGKKGKKGKNRKPKPKQKQKASTPAPPVAEHAVAEHAVAEASTSTHTPPAVEHPVVPVVHASSSANTPPVAGHAVDASTSTHTADNASTHTADVEAALTPEEQAAKDEEAKAKKKKTRNRWIKGGLALAGVVTLAASTAVGVVATQKASDAISSASGAFNTGGGLTARRADDAPDSAENAPTKRNIARRNHHRRIIEWD